MWLSAKKPRDEAFYNNVSSIIELYTHPLLPHEIVLSVDGKHPCSHDPGIVPQNLQNQEIFQIYMNMNTEEMVH